MRLHEIQTIKPKSPEDLQADALKQRADKAAARLKVIKQQKRLAKIQISFSSSSHKHLLLQVFQVLFTACGVCLFLRHYLLIMYNHFWRIPWVSYRSLVSCSKVR